MVFTSLCELLRWHKMTHFQLLCTCMAEDEGTAIELRSDTLQSKSRHSPASYTQCCTQALLLHPLPFYFESETVYLKMLHFIWTFISVLIRTVNRTQLQSDSTPVLVKATETILPFPFCPCLILLNCF